MDIQKYCVDNKSSIMQTLSVIEANHERGAFVVNQNNKVEGFISQGDVIKALMSGVNLYSPVINIANPSFTYIKTNSLKKGLEIFRKRNITLLPIVDDDFKIIDVITLREILSKVDIIESED